MESVIQEKRVWLVELSGQVRELESSINELLLKMAALNIAVNRAVEKWNM